MEMNTRLVPDEFVLDAPGMQAHKLTVYDYQGAIHCIVTLTACAVTI